MFCFFKHAVLPDIVMKKEKHFVTFNRKENKIIDSSWSLMLVMTKTCAILGKYLNLNLPVQGNGCMEITTASFPMGFTEIVHRAINCTALSPLLLTLQFLHFYISTSLLHLVLEPCLVCAAQLAYKRSLAGLPSRSRPSPPTKSILPTVWHSYSYSHTYTYWLKNVSFGIWLLQSRNIWEGDKNRIRRAAEKLEMKGKS